MTERTVAVIPARYASTRFPGKILADLCGKPVVQHVYEKAAASAADEVFVATDSDKVAKAVEAFGGKVVMTSPVHPSGTDRIYEAVSDIPADIVINVQGDEPLIPVSVIDELIKVMLEKGRPEMATVAVPREREEFENDPNMVKVVMGNDGYALYFSRSMIPFLRDGGVDMETYLHWGIYAYRKNVLEKIVKLPEGRLERCEKLEQLRALENGIKIYVHLTKANTIGIDTPEDLEEAKKQLEKGIKV
jgi:3-deoxy-manno-octulosonate cytidylyltransferase (CMP-KDO synthetase)